MLPLVLVASAMTDPDKGSSGGTLVLVAAAIVLIAGLCLYLLFRRGSIADRARTDMPDGDRDEATTEPGSRSHDADDTDDTDDSGDFEDGLSS